MAKRLIDWNAKTNGVLELSEYVSGEEYGKMLETFDLKKIFPQYEKLNEVQRFLIIYGTKQKLADAGSSEKTAEDKAKAAGLKFDELVEGKLQAPRANASQVKENKRIAGKAKEISQVVSLEGLMMKKIAFPDTFTEEDQKKLNELMVIKVEMEVKAKAKSKKSK